ncbi:tRNA lysidine(34) synthetase TilS [Aeromicrobium terrae]|nr:tRNA lysidine(34) synthetase TilS [Aeromicrobium terrae]
MGPRLDPAVAEGRRAVLAALTDLEPGARVEVALSGGADSLALAACLAFLAPREGWLAGAVVVDHALQDGSAVVAEKAAAQARELGLEAEVVRVDVGTDGGPEAAARDARYGVLRTRQAEAVLLGHTLDDQAETVLLGLGRGSGPRSLAGMPERDGLVRRPFLGLRRADTERICTASGLTWWTDPHNTDPSFRRSRLRHEALPLLEDVLGGGVAEALARTAEQLRQDTDLLDALAADVAEPHDVETLAALPPALRSRVLRRLALDAGADASELAAVHLRELDRLITDWHGQQRVELPGRVSAARVDGALRFATS